MAENKNTFFTNRDKTLGKLLLLVFLCCNVFLNWSNFSWFLSFKTAPVIIGETFSIFTNNITNNFKNIKIFEKREKTEKENKSKNEDNNDDIIEEEIKINPAPYCEKNEINIPSLGVTAPLVEAGGITEKEYRESLDRGVMHFPGTSFPGEVGLSVVLGHSAPPNWPKIKHDWVFTEINNLQEGDEIEICYNNEKWIYTVMSEEDGKKIYEVGEGVPPLFPGKNRKEIVLMSCWPPGSRDSRIGVRGVITN